MEVFLTDKCLQGVHLTSRKKALDSELLFSREAELKEALDQAKSAGIKKIICTTHPGLLRLLEEDPSRWPFEIFAVVPNFAQFVRDTSHYGTTGAAVRKILAMPLLKKFRLAKIGFLNVPKVLKMKFEILMNLFLMAEASRFFTKNLKVKAVVLHPQITDLALALRQDGPSTHQAGPPDECVAGGLFRLFKKIVSEEFKAEPALSTSNFGTLSGFLKDNRISFPYIMAPFNSRGYWMNPQPGACESGVSQGGSVIADHWRLSNHIPFEEGLDYLRALPFAGATVEMTDLRGPGAAERIAKLQALT